MRLMCAIVVLAGCSGASAGVEFFRGGLNIDFNIAAGSGAGQPTVLHGGAAGQFGYWNPVNGFGAPVVIRDLGNSFNAVTLTHTSGVGIAAPTMFGVNNANTGGDTELLMDDAIDLGGTASGPYIFSVGPFAPGLYKVVVYSAAPDNGTYRTRVGVGSSVGFFDERVIGGVIPAGGVMTEGVTHGTFVEPVWGPSGDIRLKFQSETGFGAVNGVQIVPVNPTRLYVATASGSFSDGLSWETALTSVQQALEMARAMPSVTEIWVKRGTYETDDFPETTGSRTAEFLLNAGLSIYGGFVGTESTLADRPSPAVAGNETVLTGEIGGVGIGDNAYRVLRVTGTGTTVLDRLVIDSGYNNIDPNPPFGSGLNVIGSTVEMRNCVVRKADGYAGMMVDQATVTMTDCVVEEGRATGVAGVYSRNSTLTMERCIVRRNQVYTTNIGTVVRADYSTVTLRNCLIQGNHPSLSPQGTVNQNGGTMRLENCTVAGNNGRGLTMGFISGDGPTAATMTLQNCVVWGNRSTDTGLSVEDQQVRKTNALHTLSVSDSIVEGWSGTLAAAAFLNIGSDPEFVDTDGADNVRGNGDDNFGLLPFSPGRDSGWNNGFTGVSVTDLAGNARRVDDPAVFNGGFSAGFIDRGCYEMQGASAGCAGDIGQTGGVPGSDGVRNNNDFIVFIDWFFARDGRADRGRQGGQRGPDGVYDNNDFIAFIDEFFGACP